MSTCKIANPTIQRVIRFVAGLFVMISVFLGYYVSEYWFLFTAFVGINLLQSSITCWCLMEDILSALGVGKDKDKKKTYA